jgi:hypothetical protein
MGPKKNGRRGGPGSLQRDGIADVAEGVVVGDLRLFEKIALADGIQFGGGELRLLSQEAGPVRQVLDEIPGVAGGQGPGGGDVITLQNIPDEAFVELYGEIPANLAKD